MAQNDWQRQMAWAYFFANQYLLGSDDEFAGRAHQAAREIMRRARANVEMLVDRLRRTGYRFQAREAAFIPAGPAAEEWCARMEDRGIFMPLALRAWAEEVGSVNLMGTHPEWTHPGYLFRRSPPGTVEWYTDPLVIEVSEESVADQFENWQSQCELDGAEEVGPFRIAVAPDDVHKANVSGGAPYELPASSRSVDDIVLNERHCVSFVAYLQLAFAWGGFPGFELIDDPPSAFLAYMREGLLPL